MGDCSCHWLLPLVLAGLVWGSSAARHLKPMRLDSSEKVDCYPSVTDTIYSYAAVTLDGKENIPFERYRGKTLLIVNVATFCELTPQYHELNALQDELRNDGLVVLGFPSNQFGRLEPGRNSEVLAALQYVRPGKMFAPNFQLFQKGDVNGDREQKIFTFLKNACPPVGEEFENKDMLFWEPLRIHDIKWNFEKFLVSSDGVPVKRWAPNTSLSKVKKDIQDHMRGFGRRPYVALANMPQPALEELPEATVAP